MMKFVNVDDIENLDTTSINRMYKRHYNQSLYKIYKTIGIDKDFVKASGMFVYDRDGNKYIDYLGGFGALNLGHNDRRIIEAVNKFICRPNMLQVSKKTFAAVLANNISFLTNGDLSYCYFTNSGTETVEEALKLVKLYKSEGKIIFFSNAYHGKTLGTLTAIGNKLKKKYKPLLKDFIEVPFGDIKKFKEVVDQNDVTAVLVEPIQGEGGINIPPKNYFISMRKICDKLNIILIFDEIQTGLGRCGEMFCYREYGILPDVMCLSKSLSGGIIPIGALVVEESLWNNTYGKLKNALLLSSTFGGNTLACAAAIKTLEILIDDDLIIKSKEMGEYALAALKRIAERHDIIKSVRGKGLMIGIEFNNLKGVIPKPTMEVIMSTIISRLMNEFNIISGITINNPSVLRFEPPLIVNKMQIEYFVNSLDTILEDEDSIIKLALSSIKNLNLL